MSLYGHPPSSCWQAVCSAHPITALPHMWPHRLCILTGSIHPRIFCTGDRIAASLAACREPPLIRLSNHEPADISVWNGKVISPKISDVAWQEEFQVVTMSVCDKLLDSHFTCCQMLSCKTTLLKECEANLDFHLLFLILILIQISFCFSQIKSQTSCLHIYDRWYIRAGRFEMVYFSCGLIVCNQTGDRKKTQWHRNANGCSNNLGGHWTLPSAHRWGWSVLWHAPMKPELITMKRKL